MNSILLTTIIWVVIYLLCFLLRKHLDFGTDKGWPKHWFVGWTIPILVWAFGAITGYLTSFQIGLIGFGLVIIAATLKELVWDKLLGKGSCTLMDWIITVSAGFASVFFFVIPILNS